MASVLSSLACLPCDVVCPHCLGRVLTCHACDGTGRIAIAKALTVVAFVWARPACDCEACAALPRVAWFPTKQN
jgi:hypothetical protein